MCLRFCACFYIRRPYLLIMPVFWFLPLCFDGKATFSFLIKIYGVVAEKKRKIYGSGDVYMHNCRPKTYIYFHCCTLILSSCPYVLQSMLGFLYSQLKLMPIFILPTYTFLSCPFWGPEGDLFVVIDAFWISKGPIYSFSFYLIIAQSVQSKNETNK